MDIVLISEEAQTIPSDWMNVVPEIVTAYNQLGRTSGTSKCLVNNTKMNGQVMQEFSTCTALRGYWLLACKYWNLKTNLFKPRGKI